MRTAHLSWDEIAQRSAGLEITIHEGNIIQKGNCNQPDMEFRFDGCEFLQLTETDYMVTRRPERRRRQ